MDSAIPETRVQVVGDFVEERGRDLVAGVVEEVDLDGPRSKGEAFHAGVLGSGGVSIDIAWQVDNAMRCDAMRCDAHAHATGRRAIHDMLLRD